jgi:elongation factor G
LDGAVLVVDAVAGVQPQTQTVWRALKKPSFNNHDNFQETQRNLKQYTHEPLPCLALINKMDKDGSNFGKAVQSLKKKLPGAYPIPIQIPLFRVQTKVAKTGKDKVLSSIVAVSPDEMASGSGEFCGTIDLLHMRAIVWPDIGPVVAKVEDCIPKVVNLLQPDSQEPIYDGCQVTEEALRSRSDLVESLAEVDPEMEEYYLNDEMPTNTEIRSVLRRATLAHKAVPVMAAAALRGKGIEPLLDAVADLLPSPLDRMPPALNKFNAGLHEVEPMYTGKGGKSTSKVALGHPLYPSLLALAFKVVHMKGRGGSGDGRIVFARVYSGSLEDRESVTIISPPAPGEAPDKPRVERIGGMLELAGGRFDNIVGGICKSGDVCALVGLKTVVTGDTLVLTSDNLSPSKQKRSNRKGETLYLEGVASPKPVITVRLEAETSPEQSKLSDALKIFCIEDPSLVVEETESATLLSGLGELHIEVTLDRLKREHGLEVMVGPPSVAYRETIKEDIETEGGLLEYDKTIGGTRLQGAVHLILRQGPSEKKSSCVLLSDPIVKVGPKAREFLGLNPDLSEEDLLQKNDLARALIRGCQGALKRGPLKAAALANVECYVENVDADDGLASLKSLPGALQAASANAVSATLNHYRKKLTILEPTMSIEVSLPNEMVGNILSDLTSRRGTVGDVLTAENIYSKSLIRGDVPLVEILGYANNLRSLTGGEGSFTAEYKGHSPC